MKLSTGKRLAICLSNRLSRVIRLHILWFQLMSTGNLSTVSEDDDTIEMCGPEDEPDDYDDILNVSIVSFSSLAVCPMQSHWMLRGFFYPIERSRTSSMVNFTHRECERNNWYLIVIVQTQHQETL